MGRHEQNADSLGAESQGCCEWCLYELDLDARGEGGGTMQAELGGFCCCTHRRLSGRQEGEA